MTAERGRLAKPSLTHSTTWPSRQPRTACPRMRRAFLVMSSAGSGACRGIDRARVLSYLEGCWGWWGMSEIPSVYTTDGAVPGARCAVGGDDRRVAVVAVG